MRLLSLVLLLAIGACGAEESTGVCNICPTAESVNTDMCATEGATAKCKTAAIMMVTDSSCGLGKPATTHQACVFSDCAGHIDCSKIVTF